MPSITELSAALADYTDYTVTLPEKPDVKYTIQCRRLTARESQEVSLMAMRALPPVKPGVNSIPGKTAEPVFDISDPDYQKTKAKYELVSRGMALWYTVKDIATLTGIDSAPTTEDGWFKVANAIADKLSEDLMLILTMYVSRGVDGRYSDFFSSAPSPGS